MSGLKFKVGDLIYSGGTYGIILDKEDKNTFDCGIFKSLTDTVLVDLTYIDIREMRLLTDEEMQELVASKV